MGTIKHAVILAAGFGTRLAPLTDSCPKPLIKINNKETIIDRIVSQLLAIGINQIYVNAHYLKSQVAQHFKDHNNVVVVEEEQLLKTGGSVLNIMNIHSLSKVLVVNCDEFFFNTKPLESLLSNFDENKMQQLLLLKQGKDQDNDFALDNKSRIIRHTTNKPFKFVGAYITSKSAFKDIKDTIFPATNLWFSNEANMYYGTITHEDVIDIGTIESLEEVRKLF